MENIFILKHNKNLAVFCTKSNILKESSIAINYKLFEYTTRKIKGARFDSMRCGGIIIHY